MTGTGTQNDPYIPTTLTEFIAAVRTSGAYVALESDINAADDPEYGGELTSTISWAAAEVDGRDHSLIGVTMREITFFLTTRASSLKSFTFRECALKKGTSNAVIFDGSGGILSISDCKLGFKVDGEAGSTVYLTYNINFTDCAGNVEYTGNLSTQSNTDTVFDKTAFTRTTIKISGLTSSKRIRLLQWQSSCVRSAIIIENMTVGALDIAYNNTSYQYSYVSFGNVSGSIACGLAATTSIIATDSEASISMQSGWTRATIDQMKDEAWLSSIGWLP